ncbi:acyl-CoA dehydrogenase family protein [Aquabacterium sp.]|uniref:acyl-CoA dehydrogenase family protein n=1 Tax=Aquabacterium sp. TaxID=1872578 RepID=UPI0037830CD2
MWHYQAPLRDMRFVLQRVLQADQSWSRCLAFAELDLDTADAVLAEAGRFASEILQPLNGPADLQGCTLAADGSVRTPDGYRAAYQAFVEGGWPALPCDPAWGGQGLPLLVDAAMREMLSASNHGWTMYPDLLHGAYETIKAHADDALKARYLPKIASGEWLAAMALTEPQAGSDLGLLRTRAEPQPDGSLRVSGSKIFISGGEHDLTDNIVHLVLCRLPDAPPGTKGISLALVPKLLPDGTRNAMVCDGIEKKMGIKGSATCAMRYEAATGWLIGAPHRGLAAMFLMMNSARLHVGLQGLGHQEMATQNALRYAYERLQMRAARRPEGAAPAAADPIAWHPAMRHTLLRLQALTEAHRVIAYRAAQCIDEAHHQADDARRQRAAALAALLTPLVKASLTRQGFEAASAALQVFGGYGYTHDYGIEQTVRDARIAMVYEGTNEIQAIDLLTRKVLADGGSALGLLLDDLQAEAARCEAEPALADFGAALRAQCGRAREATAAVQAAVATDAEAPLRVADAYLLGLTHLLQAWAFAASARAAREDSDAAWAAAKTERMRYGLQWLLPESAAPWQQVCLAAQRTLPMLTLPG